MGWCGGASELIGVRQSGACARPAGSDWCAARRWFGLISCIRVHRLGECHGTPILWHTFGVPPSSRVPDRIVSKPETPYCPLSPAHVGNPRRPTAQSRPHTLGTRDALLPGLARTLCPAHIFGARKGVLETVAAVRARRRHVSHLVTGPGSRHGLEPSLGHGRRGSRA